MKLFVVFVCAVLSAGHASAQYTQTVTPLLDTQAGVMKTLPPKIGNVTGSVYLNEEWITADLYLKPGAFSTDKIENVPVRLDLQTNTLELRTEQGVKVLDESKIDRLEFLNAETGERSVYINGNRFTLDGTPLSGFCEVSGNKVKLIRRDYLEILQPNYNVSMDVGSKDKQILKKYKLYLSKDSEMLDCNKKVLYTLMADKENEIRDFLKDGHLRLSKAEDMKAVVNYYDAISQ